MSKLKNSKFEVLCEDITTRYTQGGFLMGDFVKFKEGVLKHEWFKTQADSMALRVEELMSMPKTSILRLSCIKPVVASSFGAHGGDNKGTDYTMDVVEEYAPGLWRNAISVPHHLLEVIDTGIAFGEQGHTEALIDAGAHEVGNSEAEAVETASEYARELPTKDTAGLGSKKQDIKDPLGGGGDGVKKPKK